MQCTLLDVFSKRPLCGNALAVFECDAIRDTDALLALTREIRQFESIFFVREKQRDNIHARIFTMQEELDFAGHPLLGLAAYLHANERKKEDRQWHIQLPNRKVSINSYRHAKHFHAVMHQGAPRHITTLDNDTRQQIGHALNLSKEALACSPMEIISTGLPYLIVPVQKDLARARIVHPGFEQLLSSLGARFVYVIDVNNFEGRTWDNEGQVEDIATGSAAGPAAAYLYKYAYLKNRLRFTIQQGRFVNRPCGMAIQLSLKQNRLSDILVGGDVTEVARVHFDEALHL